MGIHIVAKSKINPAMYGEDDPNKYLNYALKDIEWETIMELLHIDIAMLYGSAINYWASEQVKDMYMMIKDIDEDPYKLYGPWKKEELTHLFILQINI